MLRPIPAPLLPTSAAQDRCRNNPNMLSGAAKAEITWGPLRSSATQTRMPTITPPAPRQRLIVLLAAPVISNCTARDREGQKSPISTSINVWVLFLKLIQPSVDRDSRTLQSVWALVSKLLSDAG